VGRKRKRCVLQTSRQGEVSQTETREIQADWKKPRELAKGEGKRVDGNIASGRWKERK